MTSDIEGASILLRLAKTIIAVAAIHINAQAARQLIKSSFVHNCSAGGTEEDVRRMKGDEENPGTVAQILGQGGYSAKDYVIGGDCTEEEADSLGEYLMMEVEFWNILFTWFIMVPVNLIMQKI